MNSTRAPHLFYIRMGLRDTEVQHMCDTEIKMHGLPQPINLMPAYLFRSVHPGKGNRYAAYRHFS